MKNRYNLAILLILFLSLSLFNILLKSQEITSEELEINRRYVFSFNNDKDVKLSDSMKKLLDFMIEKTKDKSSKYRIKIDAHSSSLKLNAVQLQKISDDRAMNAYKYVLSKGVSKSRILYRGYSNRMQIAEPNSQDGISKNNRIEFMLSDK